MLQPVVPGAGRPVVGGPGGRARGPARRRAGAVRRLAAVLLPALLLLATGCGVSEQPRPVTIDVPLPSEPPQPSAPGGSQRVTVYFVRDDRLEPTRRSSPAADVASAMEQLVAGPSTREGRLGLRSAVGPTSSPAVTGVDPATGTVVIEVPPELIATSGRDQLLAVAQLVWTATEVPGIELVSLTNDGDPIEVPTDEGLSRVPVARDQYRTVAPAADRTTGGAAGDG